MSLHMLDSTDDASSDPRPVDSYVSLFVHKSTNGYVLTSDQVQSMGNLRAWLFILLRQDDALDRLTQNNIRKLVTG